MLVCLTQLVCRTLLARLHTSFSSCWPGTTGLLGRVVSYTMKAGIRIDAALEELRDGLFGSFDDKQRKGRQDDDKTKGATG